MAPKVGGALSANQWWQHAMELSHWQRWMGRLLQIWFGTPFYVWMFVDPPKTTAKSRSEAMWRFMLYAWTVITIEIAAVIWILGLIRPLSCTTCGW